MSNGNNNNNNNIFYQIKKHPILSVALLIIFYIVIPILPFIQSSIGIFSKEDATLFLTYYGTIISGLTGGSLTVGGVWWTIKKQEEQREEDLANQYRPVLSNITKYYDVSLVKDCFSISITLKNVGRSEITNFMYTIMSNDASVTTFSQQRSFLAKNDTVNIKF